MKKVFITGIGGAAGSYLAEFIAEFFPNVIIAGSARTPEPKYLNIIKDKVKIYQLDLCDFNSTFLALKDFRPDVIFHLASSVDVSDSFKNPSSYINNNINLTLNVFESVRTLKNLDGYNPIIQLCSTSEVYGGYDGLLTEDTPISPINPYAVSKVCQDNLATVYYKCYGLKIHKIRMFSYFNSRRKNLATSSFARQIIEIEQGKRDTLNHGSLDSKRTILDIRDVVEAYWVGSEKCIDGEAYNVASEEFITIKEVLELLKNQVNIPIKCVQSESLIRPTDIKYQIPSIDKFKKTTGWKPRYSLEESIKFFFSEMRKEL